MTIVWERFNRVFHIFRPQSTGKKNESTACKSFVNTTWITLFPHQFIVKSHKSLLTGEISWKPTISPRNIVHLIWQVRSVLGYIFRKIQCILLANDYEFILLSVPRVHQNEFSVNCLIKTPTRNCCLIFQNASGWNHCKCASVDSVIVVCWISLGLRYFDELSNCQRNPTALVTWCSHFYGIYIVLLFAHTISLSTARLIQTERMKPAAILISTGNLAVD